MNDTSSIDIWDSTWLRNQIIDVLEFYYPQCLAEEGYHHQFLVDGTVEQSVEPLVGTCRFTYNFAVAADIDGPDWSVDAARHGLDRLQTAFTDNQYGGYYWELNEGEILDATKYAYGHAFVLLALARITEAGIEDTTKSIASVYELLEKHWYNPERGLYAVEATREWKVTEYRGQNANMHLCEACLAAYEATGKRRYLRRASTIADAVVRGLAHDGNVWEHFDEDWTPDWTYNIDDPENLFRPHGYLPGHFVEWAKLLCLLEQYESTDWRVQTAVNLFERAVDIAWDHAYGGLQYTVNREGQITNRDKYYWVTAEQLAAASTLTAAGEPFDAWYERTWESALGTHVTEQGAWWRVRGRDGSPISESTPLSPPNKTDYHVVSALDICRKTMV